MHRFLIGPFLASLLVGLVGQGDRVDAAALADRVTAMVEALGKLTPASADTPAVLEDANRVLVACHASAPAQAGRLLAARGTAFLSLSRFSEGINDLEAARELLNAPEDATRRDNADLRLAWAKLRVGQADASLALLGDVIERAREREDRKTLAVALQQRGEANGSQGRSKPALADFGDALELHEAASDEAGVAAVLAMRAGVYLERRNGRLARADLDRARAFYERTADAQGLGAIAMREATMHKLGRDIDAALVSLRAALAHFEAAGQILSAADAATNLANTTAETGRTEEALPLYARAIAAYDTIGNPLRMGMALYNRGATHRGRGDAAAAHADFARAAELFGNGADERMEGYAVSGRGSAGLELGRLEAAEADFDTAEELMEKCGDAAGLAQVRFNRAGLLYALGRNTQALEACQQAEPEFARRGALQQYAMVAQTRAAVLNALGRPSQALIDLDRVEAFYRTIDNPIGLAGVAVNRGASLILLGRRTDALAELARAEEVARAADHRPTLLRAYQNRAVALQDLGRLDDALADFDRALACLEPEDRVTRATILGNRSMTYFYQRRFEPALEGVRAALTTLIETGSTDHVRRMRENEALILSETGHEAEALATLDALLTDTDDPGERANTELNRGAVLGDLRRFEEAERSLAVAAEHYVSLGSEQDLAGVAQTRGDLLLAQGLAPAALSQFHACATHLTRAREHLGPLADLTAASMLERFRSARAHALAAFTAMPEGARTEHRALETLFAILQTFHLLDLALPDPAASDTSADDRPLLDARGAFLSARTELQACQASPPDDLEARVQHATQLASLRDRVRGTLDDLDRQVELAKLRRAPDGAAVRPEATTLADVGSALRPREILIEYIVENGRGYALRVGRGDATLIELGDATQWRTQVDGAIAVLDPRSTRRLAPTEAERRQALRGLARTILDPVLADSANDGIAPNRLCIVPADPLGPVPFEALLLASTNGTPAYAAARFEIGYVDSASALVTARRRPARTTTAEGPDLVALGDPAADAISALGADLVTAGLPPLPETGRELIELGRLVARTDPTRATLDAWLRALDAGTAPTTSACEGDEAVLLLRDAATERAFRTQAPRARRVLHLACHAIADPLAPDLSHLILTKDPTGSGDGLVFLRDLAALDLQCELLVLSACSTAAGPSTSLQGPRSLARAGLQAGAGAVLGTAWNVPDVAARSFILAFYQRWLGQRIELSVALTLARRAAIEAGADPAVWAPWVLWEG